MSRRPRERRLRLLASPVRLAALLLVFAVIYGTVGFIVIEGFGPLNALYMTVTTLTTVGFGEIEPLGPGGRTFTISLIAVGFTAAFILVALLTSQLASGQLGVTWVRKTMHRRLDSLRDHYIVCAYGRVGRAAVDELIRKDADVAVVEVDPAIGPDLVESGLAYLIDDPADEAVLEQAGIRRAKALLCAVDSDAVNVYITLTARAMNPDLFIIARASRPESVETLRRAGSNRVISPYAVSGVRMAAMALQPAVLEFVDMVSVSPNLRIEELVVGPRSELHRQTVRDVCAPHSGVMVLAVRSPDGELLVPPQAETVLSHGDVLIVVGPSQMLARLAEQAG